MKLHSLSNGTDNAISSVAGVQALLDEYRQVRTPAYRRLNVVA